MRSCELGVLSDLELVTQIVEDRCNLSFEELINRYASKAFNLAFRLTRNSMDAEEVLQDVFSAVFRKLHKFEGKSAFSSWLYRITVNCCLMRLRRKSHRNTISFEDLQFFRNEGDQVAGVVLDSAEERAYYIELRGALEEAVATLPSEYRPVFILRDVDGLSNREVSKLLNISVPAVKSRLHRARLMLRRKLRSFVQDDGDNLVDQTISVSS